MRIEIHRHRMAMQPDEEGRIAVGYDVLVPEEDVVPGAQGVIRLLSPGFRKYRSYEDATWSTRLSPGWERYVKWLEHEKAAQRDMLAMLHEHCPETRGLSKWPMFWAFVNAESSQTTVCFSIDHPGQGGTAEPAADKTATRPSELRKELEAHIRHDKPAPNWKRVGSTLVGDVHTAVYKCGNRWTAYAHHWAGELVVWIEPPTGR